MQCGELIVGFKPSVTTASQRQVLSRVSAREKRRFGRIRSVLASVGSRDVAAAIRALERNPDVLYAEPNFRLSADDHAGTPNDPSLHSLWGLNNFGQVVAGVAGTPDADIDAKEAWAVETGSDDVVVGVIDTGVDFGHPDLAPSMWINAGEDCAGCRSNGIDDDGNGYVDDWRGWDFVNDDNNPFDDNGHGTHAAGTIGAAGNNGLGISGVNWNVSLMALKFLSASGTGSTADAVSAILYASAEGADVTNNSWGGEDYSHALHDAVAAADASGSLFVAAAGNSFADTDTEPNYPSVTRPAERRRGRGHRRVRPQGLVLELRTSDRRPQRARDEHLLDLAGRLLSLSGRDVDGGASRRRRGGAREGGLSCRDGRWPEGALASNGRPEDHAGRGELDRGTAERELGGSLLDGASGLDRVTAVAARARCRRAGNGRIPRSTLRRSRGRLADRRGKRRAARPGRPR